MPFLKEKWDAFSPKTQQILQIAAGILLAGASWVFLSLPSRNDGGFFELNLIIAVLLVLLVPRVLQTQTGSDLPLMRKAMIIALLACLAGSALYLFVLRPDLITAAP